MMNNNILLYSIVFADQSIYEQNIEDKSVKYPGMSCWADVAKDICKALVLVLIDAKKNIIALVNKVSGVVTINKDQHVICLTHEEKKMEHEVFYCRRINEEMGRPENRSVKYVVGFKIYDPNKGEYNKEVEIG